MIQLNLLAAQPRREPAPEDVARDAGKARAVRHRSTVLLHGQAIALQIGRERGECCADDVYDVLAARGVDTSTLGPAAGALFDAASWVFVRWQKSRRAGNHSRAIRVWQLRRTS